MMSEEQVAQAKDIAELEVRRYFDVFLKDVLPKIVDTAVDTHDKNPASHGGVQKRFDKMLWMLIGSAAAGGGSVAGVAKLLSLI